MSDPVDPPPTAIPEPSTPAHPVVSDTGLSPKLAAGLACLFSLVGGIVFLVLEKKDKFVRFWAMQSAFLGGLAFAVSIAVQIVTLIFVQIPFLGVLLGFFLALFHLAFGLAWLVVYVISLIKSFSGLDWEIPWLGKLARKQLAQLDARQTPPAA